MKSTAKVARVTQACDACHKRGRRCRVGNDDTSACVTCEEAGLTCTRNRTVNKRGPKPGRRRAVLTSMVSRPAQKEELESFLIASFFQYVYPVSAIYDSKDNVSGLLTRCRVNHVQEREFMETWSYERPSTEEPAYARYMAMCALSAHRIVHGTSPVPRHLRSQVKPDYYLGQAVAATQFTSRTPTNLEYLQAISLICVIGLEIGDAFLVQQYMGLYHAVVAEQSLCDERRWPRNLSAVEIEQRRRVYWHMYRLEVHMALVMGHAIRCPELQSTVAYPKGENDEAEDDEEWLSGWNFVTDLYRGLEHMLTKVRLLREPRLQERSVLSTSFLLDYGHEDRILAPLMSAYENLPTRFKVAHPMSSDIHKTRCGFQTANIVCTFLVR